MPSAGYDPTKYRPRINYGYDATTKNVNQVLNNGIYTSFIWGYNQQFPIAKISGAQNNQTFYTSFEDETSNVSGTRRTGRQSFSATYTVALPSAGTYKLSYWSSSGGGSWQFNETTISANTPIGGAGVLLDDVRVFPAGAQMTTYTYDPGIGVTSITDPNSLTTFYDYDSFGRLIVIRDDKWNILKTFSYNYFNGQ